LGSFYIVWGLNARVLLNAKRPRVRQSERNEKCLHFFVSERRSEHARDIPLSRISTYSRTVGPYLLVSPNHQWA